MKVKEIIVVEGRDDTAAVKRAVDAETIETHGFGIKRETWELIDKAVKTRGIIVFTDPDHAGQTIRARVLEKYPEAKEAFLSRKDATKDGDIGIENANPEAIIEALEKVCTRKENSSAEFNMSDMIKNGLTGAGSKEKRQTLGKRLGIGYGNTSGFLRKLNEYGITREQFNEALFSTDNQGN